eukprot:TRINITY_DN13566_c0_g1_i2.p1 TRINITY_DN13566_c0_g1~~TRINITY_DN13566_c0_g1_i2.p1  ORF type:complete len:291 (+),score=71.72 TRINITY_DN13566_c0_g1_i2:251-1123(+)
MINTEKKREEDEANQQAQYSRASSSSSGYSSEGREGLLMSDDESEYSDDDECCFDGDECWLDEEYEECEDLDECMPNECVNEGIEEECLDLVSKEEPSPVEPAGEPSQEKPEPERSLPDNPKKEGYVLAEEEAEEGRDYTKIPKLLETAFDRLDSEGAVRPTRIKPGELWHHTSQEALLAQPCSRWLSCDDQKAKRDEAFDLLDGLTKGGALRCENASLHVVIAATHCFDKALVDTVVQDNMNPITKVERSLLILAGTIHAASAEQMISSEHMDRITGAHQQVAAALDSA